MPIPEIISTLIEAYNMDPYDIDNGVCDYFASDLIAALEAIGKLADLDCTPDDVDLPGHCWVEVDGHVYDAETPLGGSHWRELRIFKNSSCGNEVQIRKFAQETNYPILGLYDPCCQ